MVKAALSVGVVLVGFPFGLMGLGFDCRRRSFVFSDIDPVGQYQLEVYVDAELYRKINYDVLPELKATF